MTEPRADDAAAVWGDATAASIPTDVPGGRLRRLPAFAVASMLVAGGLLMAVGGMARLVGLAPPTPSPTVGPTAGPTITPVPTPLPSTPSLGPSPSPFGERDTPPLAAGLAVHLGQLDRGRPAGRVY